MGELTIKQATKRLKEQIGDSEGYHAEFDAILEDKVAELDPEFLKALKQLYRDSNCERWYA